MPKRKEEIQRTYRFKGYYADSVQRLEEFFNLIWKGEGTRQEAIDFIIGIFSFKWDSLESHERFKAVMDYLETRYPPQIWGIEWKKRWKEIIKEIKNTPKKPPI